MIKYIILSTVLWAILLIVYIIFIRNEKYFVYNRFFLLFSLSAGLIIPFMPKLNIFSNHITKSVSNSVAVDLREIYFTGNNDLHVENGLPIYLQIAILIYFVVAAYMVVRFLRSLIFLNKYYRSGDKVSMNGYQIIILDKPVVAFSFMNKIFIGKDTFQSSQIEKILMHESIHIRHKHFIDIFLIEILRIVFWFNPLIYFYKKYLKEVHEFEADDNVIRHFSKKTYSETLINHLQSGMQYELANYFINSLIKKRIKMMYKQNSNKRWKYFTLIPVMILVLLLVNACNTSISENQEEKDAISNKIIEKLPSPDKKKLNGEDIFQIVEEMPIFFGCDDIENKEERTKCSNEKFMQYIYSNLKYPKEAREKGIEGRVVARFVVTKKGEVKDITILRDIGAGCGDEVKRVIENMNSMPQPWVPGKQNNESVNVYYTLPVIFKLDSK